MDDPALSMRLPAGWQTVPIPQLRVIALQQSSAASGPVKALFDQLLSDIDASAIRLYAAGPSGYERWEASMIAQVTKAASVEEQIATVKARAELIANPTTPEQTTVNLAVGAGVRLEQTADPPAGEGVVARGIDYIVELEDGRILWINSTAPAESKTFEDMIDNAVGTISRR